jgi:hypothetical protein
MEVPIHVNVEIAHKDVTDAEADEADEVATHAKVDITVMRLS